MPIADNPASYEQLGRLSKRVNSRIDVLEQNQANANAATAVGIPVIDGGIAPTFTGGKKAKRNTVRVVLGFASFGSATDIKVVMVYRSDIASADDYATKRFSGKLVDKIDSNAQAAQEIVTAIDVDLLRGETVDIIRLVSIDSNGSDRGVNPQGADPTYAGYFANVVYSFDTPADLGVVAAAGPNLVNGGGMMNSFDQYTVYEGGASTPGDDDFLGKRWETQENNTGDRIDRLGSGGGGSYDNFNIQWLDTNAMLKLGTHVHSLNGRPSTRIQKRIIAGETYTFQMLTAADSAVNNVKFVVALTDQFTADDIILEVTATNWVFSVIPEWKKLVAVLRVPPTYVQTGRQWLAVRLTDNPADVIYLAKWKLESGENISIWTPHQEEQEIDSQADIDPLGHGNFGQSSGGILDNNGTVFGGPDGTTIGHFVY